MGLGSTLYNPFPSKLMFTKFDQEGEVLSYDLVMGDSLTQYYPLSSSTKDRKVVAVGGAGGSITNESGFYALYDLDNGIEWIKQYYPPNGWTIYFTNCFLFDDKIYILANQKNTNNGNITSAKLICTDLLGDILWEKDYGNNNFNFRAKAITLNQNSNIYLGFSRYEFPQIQDENAQSLIYELDLEGNVIAEWLNDEIYTYSPEQFIETEDSSLLFVGKYLTGHNANNYPLWQGYICKVDSLNNRDWSLKTGKPTFTTDMNNLISTMDGNYIALGVTFDSLSSSMVATESGHIIKFNIDGEILWEKRHYGIDTDAEYNKPYDIVELADSSLLICGESVDVFGDFPYRGWLLKLDKYGNLDSSTAIHFPKLFKDNVLIFPNPAQDQIEISLKENTRIHQIEIFDAAGRMVNSKKYQTFKNQSINFNIAHLNAGIYFVKINSKYLKKIVVF